MAKRVVSSGRWVTGKLMKRVDALLAMGDSDQVAQALLDDPVLRADEGLVTTAFAMFEERSGRWSAASQATALVSLWLICTLAIPPAQGDDYNAVLDQAPAPVAAAALLQIGQIHAAQGRMDRASRMFRIVLAIGDGNTSPQAALLLAEQSDLTEAERLCRQVLADWPAAAPAAQVQLGLLLSGRGQLQDAMLAYEQAAGSNDTVAAPRAMVNLGDLSRRTGNESLAQSWYERAMSAGNDFQADRAAVNLASLHLVRGELDAAALFCERGLASSYPDIAEVAGNVRDQITRQRRALDAGRGASETGGAAPQTGEAMPGEDGLRLLGPVIKLLTWYETYDFVKRYPETVGDGRRSVIPALRWLVPQVDGINAELGRSKHEAAEDVNRHRFLLAVLEQCRTMGIDAAFAQLGPGGADVPASLRLLALQVREACRAGDAAGDVGADLGTGAQDDGASTKYDHDALAATLAMLVHPGWESASASFRAVMAVEAGQVLVRAYYGRPATPDDRARLDAAANALLPALDEPASTAASAGIARLVRSILLIGMTISGGDDERLLAAAEVLAQDVREGLGVGDAGPSYLVGEGVHLLSAYDDWWGRDLTLDWRIGLLRAATAFPQASAKPRVLLAETLIKRFERRGVTKDLSEAIGLFESVHRECEAGSHQRARIALGFAALLAHADDQGPRIDDLLSEAAAFADSRLVGDPHRTRTLLDLARVHLLRYGLRRRSAAGLAVALAERALAEAGRRADVLAVLGQSLLQAYSDAADYATLQRAFEMLDAAWRERPLDVESAEDATEAAWLVGYHSGDYGPLHDVLGRLREIIRTSEPDPHLRLALGKALQNIGEHLGDRALLDEAAEVFTELIEVVPPAHRPGAMSDLAGCMLARTYLTGETPDLDRVVELASAAPAVTPADSKHRAFYLSICANAHFRRYQAYGALVDLDAAIGNGSQAVANAVTSSPMSGSYLGHLATYLQVRSELPGHEADAAAVMATHRKAVATTGSHSLLLTELVGWLKWAGTRHAWQDAAEAADAALAAWGEKRRAQTLQEHRQARLRLDQNVAGMAAYVYAMAGRPADAALALERGRAIGISEALEEARYDLEGLAAQGHADLVNRYYQAAAALRRITGSGLPGREVLAADIARVQARLDSAIMAIRAIPGRERFLGDPEISDVHEAAKRAPIVYLALSTFGGIALVVTARSVSTVSLPGLTADTLLEQAGAFYAAQIYGEHGPSAAMVDKAARWLGDTIMRPVLHALSSSAARVVLIPTGLLAMLPLHAAIVDAELGLSACDQLCMSYVPNARVLLAADDRAKRSAADHVLVVAEPLPTTARPLRHAAAEAVAVEAAFPEVTSLRKEKATRDAVLANLGSADVVHFACHGRAEPQRPLEGHVLIADDHRLTVADFMAANLSGISLVVLSACETARADLVILEEALGLPGAILQAGASAVIGTLWEVNDLASMLVIRMFYRLWRTHGVEPPEALRLAQIWLRDSSMAAKQAAFPDVTELAPPEPRAAAVWDRINPYHDPRYWAPYVYVGAWPTGPAIHGVSGHPGGL